MAPKDRPSRPLFDERIEPESTPPRASPYHPSPPRGTATPVPRPDIPTNVARELGAMDVRIGGLEERMGEIEDRLEVTDHAKQSALEKKLEEYEKREAERVAKENDRKAALDKERRDRRFDLFKSLALLALGGAGGLLVSVVRDCRQQVVAPAAPPLVVPVPVPAAPAVDAGAK